MSHVHRLRTAVRIFFLTVNLRRVLAPLGEEELGLVVDALAESRRKLQFLLYGYVVMPDHWHALIWTTFPLSISRVKKPTTQKACRGYQLRAVGCGLGAVGQTTMESRQSSKGARGNGVWLTFGEPLDRVRME